MAPLDTLTVRQDTVLGPDLFVVRLTRRLPDGTIDAYEDRGSMDAHGAVVGTTGFGGTLQGQTLPNGATHLWGEGGAASFTMVATPTAQDHYRCLRRIEVHRPTRFGVDLVPGVYYMTTEDSLQEVAEDAPAELNTPLNG
ncbi:hypothetical protein OG946_30975 [Streptomyces sp. NBC_01808]|uniref:hypothetical protein n=1 Tax=Streptomyces sp. NBC_01808 TaxID=2975947 RepID=UPI002DD8EDDC|nr:hypothetical protein [Streptomyces sp. NBC_01808]WSA41420.1 hypothetical protein OG946_30975 [Streptomyces sp. NBC_01808]